ncbi:superoxide dismutase [Clostridium botulinum]|uniref:Superoxide dismutase n=1 Tax=Clostridium botulinum TaxID=1491 RepID=A0A6B4JPC1_CLOBO|nr:superoxide dismutase [Clostridium botulinum]EES49673.1 superoxide dismutase [Clostridium botulinum E1 str. 'BoNT E Beluga']MBY6761933.1 superoxide dismutase [Clostridium botulinum]MBY6920859.1 superoxide dismutase [Clostridium botulinum]MCR1131392.1 superoxide dismutase [Clostridium botulinum]NFH69691.1 superoxide dismutase [Clostridium botulinum]
MFDKIKLQYTYNALEPYIDAETLNIHYNKHLQTYVNNLNKLLKGYEELVNGKTLEQILYNVGDFPKEIRQDLINQGGGVMNHNLYFYILSPKPKEKPDGILLYEINNKFGDIENFKIQLSNIAISQFGSGYGFLVKDSNGNLSIVKTLNQNSPISNGLTPILCIDVWEHAYYLKYKNLRAEYVKNIWNVIDWSKVQGLYENYVI